jgi:hypothetical protein
VQDVVGAQEEGDKQEEDEGILLEAKRMRKQML